MSSSTTITIFVYMNWRRYDQIPNISRFACPGYSFLMLTTATRYEQASLGRKKSTISGNCVFKIGTNTSFNASPRIAGSSGGRPVYVVW